MKKLHPFKWLKGRGKRLLVPILCGTMAAGAIGIGIFTSLSREPESGVLSAGLQQLADGRYLATSAVVGEVISFTPEWFDGACGSAVSAISVTRLPAATEGTLMLGHGEVTVGQTIPRESLSYLSFIPHNDIENSSFCFVPATGEGHAAYALTCQLRITDAVNCCPTGTKTVTAVSTHESLALSGTLTATDPEGDALYFEVDRYPQNGTLSVNPTTGAFVYTPNAGYVGEDQFVWRVQDACGAFAPSATVTVTVRESVGYTFADMEGLPTHTHALRVSDAGLLGGEQVGGKHYFRPHKELTRAAFVTVLLHAAEIKAPATDSTGYTDDADIPAPMKGAIKYAKEQGWLGEGDAFRPNDPITRAEAARIAAAVLGLSAPQYSETVDDHGTIPVDVADAMYAIYEGGYITTMADGTLAPRGALTRGDAAKFFARILDGKASEEQ